MIDSKKIIGITGGIASGKSTVSAFIKELGYPVIDSDMITKELSEKGKVLYDAIASAFGPEYLLPNLELDRKKIGRLIFNDSSARLKLNQITHPIIVEEILKKIKKEEKKLIFLDIPLLFEAKLSYLCDTIICVYVSKEIQLMRLMNRDKISKEYALMKINSQMSLEEKRNLSDYVILSTEDFHLTKQNTMNIIEQIKGEKNNG